MTQHVSKSEINFLKSILKYKHIPISGREIERKLKLLQASQSIFPKIPQRALLIQLLYKYEHTKQKEIIIMEDIGAPKLPITVVLGALAEDWPGMSNSILGIIHKKANVLFAKGFTVDYHRKTIGIVILSFELQSLDEYHQFLHEKKNLMDEIKEASRGSASKTLLLEDETIKFEIYNNITNDIKRTYKGDDLDNLVGENGEALKFVSSRSREYLEERATRHLAKLIVDNHTLQEAVLSGETESALRIKNVQTIKERLTGITFVCKEAFFSVEDFLDTLKFMVPDHIIKHHKSYVSKDGVLNYRIEIVDRNEMALSPTVISTLNDSLKKLITTAHSSNFTQIKEVGGFEHYARAILPFLMEELNRTQITQVFINSGSKTDFSIDIKLIIVGYSRKKNLFLDITARLAKIPGIDITSMTPPRIYKKDIEINIMNLNIQLSEFSSIQQIYNSIKQTLKKIYNNIRDFDEGFREIDMKILRQLIEHLQPVNPTLIKEIYYNFDELYRLEVPFDLLRETINFTSSQFDSLSDLSEKDIVIRFRQLEQQGRSLIVAIHSPNRTILPKLVKSFADAEINMTKINWNQRTATILILSKQKKPLPLALIQDTINNCC